MSNDSTQLTNRNILQIVQKIQKTICKKQLIESSTNLLLSISGGQDSIFLLFCLSFLQTQISFTFKAFWCNHFWQTDSFYTTLHLTKYAVNLSFPLITFIPLHDFCLKYSDINLEKKQVKLYQSLRNFVEPLPDVYLLSDFPCLSLRCLAGASQVHRFSAGLRSKLSRSEAPARQTRVCEANQSEALYAMQAFAKQAPHSVSEVNEREIGEERIQRIKESKNEITIINVKKLAFFNWDNVCNSSFKKFLPLRRQSWQVSYNYVPFKKIGNLFSEGIARNWRHITTERSSSFYTLEKTIYGHTLSDKIETIIFNLIRGAGKNGITPLLWKRKSSKFSYNKFYCSFERVQKTTHLSCI